MIIANPASFLTQKVLIHSRPSRPERAKDIPYLHGTLEIFGARLLELRNEWVSNISPRRPTKIVSRLRKTSGHLSPEALREACPFGIRQVFG